MSDSSYFRQRAAQARRLADSATDPKLAASLTRFADDYDAQADAIEAAATKGIDPDHD
jgi:hypothetical protein